MSEQELALAIEKLEQAATTDNEWRLINYLRANYLDILEAFSE